MHISTEQFGNVRCQKICRIKEKKNFVSHRLNLLKIPHHRCEEFLGIAKDMVQGSDTEEALVEDRGEILGLNESFANCAANCV